MDFHRVVVMQTGNESGTINAKHMLLKARSMFMRLLVKSAMQCMSCCRTQKHRLLTTMRAHVMHVYLMVTDEVLLLSLWSVGKIMRMCPSTPMPVN